MRLTSITDIVKSEIPEGNIREKICYFVEYYDFAGKRMGKGTLEFYPLNPHVILRILEDELKNHANRRNLSFLRGTINKVKSKDYVCREKYSYLIEQLLQFILSDKEYALQICKELLERMAQGKYAKNLCERLEAVLFNDKTLDKQKEEIKYLVVAIWIEQKIYGYSTDHVQNLLIELFRGWEYVDGIVYTNYPFVPEFEKENRSQHIKEYMESLTVRNRIHDMRRIFEQKPEKYVFVCGISGMKGQELDLEIGNVKIYNANLVPKFDFEKEGYEEDFLLERINSPIHAAVELCSIDKENFKEDAKREIEKALDIICCYSQIQVPIYIDMSQYVVMDENLQSCMSGGSIDDYMHRDLRGLNYDRDNLEELQDLYQKYTGAVLEEENNLSLAIQNSARWFRKGEEANREEDKLLNYWISLESLFPEELELPKEVRGQSDEKSKFNDICSIVPTMLLRKRLFQYFWECYYFCNNLYLNNRNVKTNNPFPISEEVAKKCDFKAEGRMYLVPFLESLEEIIKQIPDGAAKDYLIEVQDYVSGKSTINKLIAMLESEYADRLLMGYRFRNIIVHNAQSNMDFIAYYEKQLRSIAGDVIRLVIHLYEEHPNWNMTELLMRKNIENREMIEELKKQKLVAWMKEKG